MRKQLFLFYLFLCSCFGQAEQDYQLINLENDIEQIYRTNPVLPLILDKVCAILQTATTNSPDDVFIALADQLATFSAKFNALDTAFTPTDIQAQISGTFTLLGEIDQTICEKFNQTWTILPASLPTVLNGPGPITITQPGSYCLNQSIAGPITIDADNVFLDLNANQISGGTENIIVSGHQTIAVKNGSLASASNAGVSLANAQNIQLLDLVFNANAQAVLVDTATAIMLESCSFKEQTSTVVTFNNVVDSTIARSVFVHNQESIITIADNSACCAFDELTLCNNTSNVATVTLIDQDSSCRNCSFNDITINNNHNLSGDFTAFGLAGLGNTIAKSSINANSATLNFFGIVTPGNCTLEDSSISHNRGTNVTGVSLQAATAAATSCMADSVTINDNTASNRFVGIQNAAPVTLETLNLDTITMGFNSGSDAGVPDAIRLTDFDNATMEHIFISNNLLANGIIVSDGKNVAIAHSNISTNMGLSIDVRFEAIVFAGGVNNSLLREITINTNVFPFSAGFTGKLITYRENIPPFQNNTIHRAIILTKRQLFDQIIFTEFQFNAFSFDAFTIDSCIVSGLVPDSGIFPLGIGFSIASPHNGTTKVYLCNTIIEGNNRCFRADIESSPQSLDFVFEDCIFQAPSFYGVALRLTTINGASFQGRIKNCIANAANQESATGFELQLRSDSGGFASIEFALENNICNNTSNAFGQGIHYLAVDSSSNNQHAVTFKDNICCFNGSSGVRVVYEAIAMDDRFAQVFLNNNICFANSSFGFNRFPLNQIDRVALFNNIAQGNGSLGAGNYVNTPTTILATFDEDVKTFSNAAGNLDIFSNLDVIEI